MFHDLVVGTGTFDIKEAAAVINVSGDVSVGADGRLFAVAGAIINLTGANFFNYSKSMTNLSGLGNLKLFFLAAPLPGKLWK